MFFQLHCERYFPGYVLSQRLGISPNLLSRLTGTVFAMAGEAELAREQQNPHKVFICKILFCYCTNFNRKMAFLGKKNYDHN